MSHTDISTAFILSQRRQAAQKKGLVDTSSNNDISNLKNVNSHNDNTNDNIDSSDNAGGVSLKSDTIASPTEGKLSRSGNFLPSPSRNVGHLSRMDKLSIEEVEPNRFGRDPIAPVAITPSQPPAARKPTKARERKVEKLTNNEYSRGLVKPTTSLFDPKRDNTQDRTHRNVESSRTKKEGNKPRANLRNSKELTTAVVPTPPTVLRHPPSKNVSTQSVAATEDDPKLFRAPETKPISQDQLIAEVKGIYAGLVMVEAKCIEVDSKQAQLAMKQAADRNIKTPPFNNDQWQALIALHRTLLHEHHDFFLASQHPSALPSLRRLASKYAMPARMWRHGIHSILEILRHKLPASQEHMMTFIYFAYSMMALLYETVPVFADTWVECLGDLSRYRMAIEEGDVRDREVWTSVSQTWYMKGIDRNPNQGRLYHHLAILSHSLVLKQLFYYAKALIVGTPFISARESILTLFAGLNMNDIPTVGETTVTELNFVKIHGILFQSVGLDQYETEKDNLMDHLDKRIGDLKDKFKIFGAYIAVCGIAGIWQYNSKHSRMKVLCKDKETSKSESDVKSEETELTHSNMDIDDQEFDNTIPGSTNKNEDTVMSDNSYSDAILIHVFEDIDGTEIAHHNAIDLFCSIFSLLLERSDDVNILPSLHVHLVLLNYLTDYPMAIAMIANDLPWNYLVAYINDLVNDEKYKNYSMNDRVRDFSKFPMRERNAGRLLPEDYLMRGLDIAKTYFPPNYFERFQVDEHERMLDVPSFVFDRVERIVWLMYRISQRGPWISFDDEVQEFSVTEELESAIKSHRQQIKQNNESKKIKVEDDDMEMDMPIYDSEDSLEIMDDESEAAILINQRRALRKQLNEPVISQDEQEKTEKMNGKLTAESFKPGYTVVVVDTNSLLKNVDMYKSMINSNKWTICLPYSVLTELNGLMRNGGNVAQTSQLALNMIDQALSEKRQVRVVTAKGSLVTDIRANYKELIDSYRTDASDGRQNLDDIIIHTAQQQGDAIINKLGIQGDGSIKPVVLVTDDTVMRVKAFARSVPSIKTKQWTKHLSKVDSVIYNLERKFEPNLKKNILSTGFHNRFNYDLRETVTNSSEPTTEVASISSSKNSRTYKDISTSSLEVGVHEGGSSLKRLKSDDGLESKQPRWIYS